jgi:hypothetical protein
MPSEESKTESMKDISQAKWSIQIVASKLENQAETLSMCRKTTQATKSLQISIKEKSKILKTLTTIE